MSPIHAGSMNELDYQGKVLLNDIPFTGDGFFKFAISDENNSTNFWANDGTGSGEPAGSITNPVWNGLFSVILGSAPMSVINPDTFSSTNSRFLRVWFSSGSGFIEMLPAQKIVGSAYSVNSLLVGGMSASTIQSNAVSQATNAITLVGDIIGPPHANSIAPGVIVNADVNVAAAIDGTKVVQGTTVARGTLALATGSTGTTAIAAGHPYLNAFSQVNSIIAGAPNSAFGIVGAGGITVVDSGTNVVITDTALANLDNTIWVALNGTPAGPGTIDRPFDTPQAGYDAAAATFPGAPSTVIIAAGDYASAGYGITMSSGTVHVLGLHRPRIAYLDVTALADFIVLGGYQNVEGMVIGGSIIFASSGGIRFHNCRIQDGVGIRGTRVIFQNCRITAATGSGAPALALATAPGQSASLVGVYQSSLENRSPGAGTIEISYPGIPSPNVQNLEVIGCEIVNGNGAFGPAGTPGPAIQDYSPFHGAGFPAKLFTHNYIKGPLPDPGAGFAPPAISDPGVLFPFPPGTGPFLAFYHNYIQGSAGVAPAGVAHPQFYGQNTMVGGLINNVGGPVGWLQAGAGTGMDAFGNVEHELVFPFPLPDNWDD